MVPWQMERYVFEKVSVNRLNLAPSNSVQMSFHLIDVQKIMVEFKWVQFSMV